MNAVYTICFFIAYPIVRLLFPCRFYGTRNIPAGPAIVCANHSSFIDPVLIALAFGHRRPLHFMAKAELFRVIPFRGLLRALGAFPIERGEPDIGAVRTAVRHLKGGRKIMIFPEGTRVAEDESAAPKSGAVRIAAKLGAPVLPIYITTKKKALRCSRLIIGEPFKLHTPANKDYAPLAAELMDRILSLEMKR
ncbi:MAG: 1-acyl-sn-glycerol-3-phosphate acyltransferase [Oscillospiraceae bacterium]|jgi:1-acyl-sn-glycerol-3-phosphate acyltransferase|nr:1-acyl-sn-glycerol-3-phosphate acyltransferase [Oscillospiraceae bacterium]